MIPVPSLPEEELIQLKEQFNELLRSTQRDGIENLISWLEESTDFYEAPASTSKHGAIVGGLIRHSLNVYKYLQNFCKQIKEVPEDSMIISALLHDLCKANFYSKRVRNVKIPGERRWEEEESFYVDDQFPMGHGEKSMFLAMRHITLSDDEALAIRWHMGGYDDAARSYASGMSQSNAYALSKLAVALNIADMYTSHLVGY